MRPLRMLAGSQKRKLVGVSREIVADDEILSRRGTASTRRQQGILMRPLRLLAASSPAARL
jgi:hypothetical protein